MPKKGKGKGKKDKAKSKSIAQTSVITTTVVVPKEPVFDRKLPVFSFDFVMTRLDVTGVQLTDPRKLVVSVTFGGNHFDLTASKTKVDVFDSNATLTFQKEPKDLANDIVENGLSFEVCYDSEVVGVGKVRLPRKLTNSINLDMTEFSYTRTCRLEMGGKPKGKLEFLCKLFIKCGDYARVGETCRNLDTNISPQDIVFVIGKSKNHPNLCDPCREALEIAAKKEKDYVIQSSPNHR
ncbi:uncharacterized protein LOC110186776 [Drosophila serrata]|uniref:uncharacterized protein LOC110186776 n=1 Tax=Drosophila serrata TaxID=7274 RepID=UPI000A1D2393|nr:uncharacterized protein LOC110186776 [Drosophila serrata]KAH8375806.1 hypothetical protein KR200_000037 [Drosophila serrata]